MDIGGALSYPRKDPQWLSKIGIYALMMLGCIFIIPIFPMMGYQIAIIRKVASGEDELLPAWDNWGEKFMDGLKIFGVVLVYEIPMFLIMGIGFGITFAMAAGSQSSDSVGGVMAIVMLLIQALSGIYGLILGFLMPIFMIMVARTGEFGAAFKFGEMFGFIGKNLGNYFITFLLFIGFFLAAEIIGLVACCIGIFFTFPYAYMAVGHLMGQLMRKMSPSLDEV